MKPVKAGLIGLGTVGGGTFDILLRNRQEIAGRAGREILVTRVAVANLEKPRTQDLHGIQVTANPMDIVNDPEIDIVVELAGGDDVAKEVVLAALANGKHVVTANKALIAVHGNEIFDSAHRNGVMVAFESAVAGGIPVIKSLREGLSANRIAWVAGIINGTCNYILTRMESDGLDFDVVLKDAQALGYAEADPEFDIEGIDAAHKLTILASIAFGIPLQFDRVSIEGITDVTIEDIHYARELGFRIKHLGIARRIAGQNGDRIELRVHPTMIPNESLLAHVNGVMNAVMVEADAVGSTLYYGPGAGAEPTGSAVVADIIDVTRVLTADPENRVPHLAFQAGSLANTPVLEISEVAAGCYLRMRVINQPGVLARITRVFGDSNISINTILQKGHQSDNGEVTIIMLTDTTPWGNLQHALHQIEAFDSVSGKVSTIRLESLA